VALGAALVFGWGEGVPAPLAPGDRAPGFELPALGGDQTLALESQAGRVVLLNFWATWCGPCEEEMPSMERLHRGLAAERFSLLAVSVDDDAAAVEAFRARLGLTFPILLDPDETAARLYQTTGYPESILIDAAGRVVERYVGPRAWDDPLYAERIRALLAGRESGS
jgi:peroxiredoxin